MAVMETTEPIKATSSDLEKVNFIQSTLKVKWLIVWIKLDFKSLM
tara:strand:+ start:301 stop:435 length:135 start_codon:yes stop_codon:yes gene_type:complete